MLNNRKKVKGPGMIKISRRDVLKTAGTIGGALLAPGLPLWSLAEAAPRERAPAGFVNLSSALLGIDAGVLNPVIRPDDVSMADVFYGLTVLAGKDSIANLLTAYDLMEKQHRRPDQIAQVLLASGDGPNTSMNGAFSRLITLMWLYGTWYGQTEINNIHTSASGIAADYRKDFVISSRAYKNAWIWRIAQTHPMGFSQFSFGSWASAPPSLADYGISLA